MADDWYLDPELARRRQWVDEVHLALTAAQLEPSLEVVTEAIAADSAYGELFQRLRAAWYADEGVEIRPGGSVTSSQRRLGRDVRSGSRTR